jgi:hypothetical protein
MKTFFVLGAVIVLINITRLSHAQVAYDQNSGTDFKKFKTYAWLAPGDSVLNRYRRDKLYGGSITYAANQELTSRGLKLDSLNPDAIFVFYTTREEITTYSQTPQLSVGIGVAGPGYYVGGMAPVAGGDIIATTKQEGELKYAMYDTETKKLVWTGQATKTFKLTEDVHKLVVDYTAKIFKKFPVKKGKK